MYISVWIDNPHIKSNKQPYSYIGRLIGLEQFIILNLSIIASAYQPILPKLKPPLLLFGETFIEEYMYNINVAKVILGALLFLLFCCVKAQKLIPKYYDNITSKG